MERLATVASTIRVWHRLSHESGPWFQPPSPFWQNDSASSLIRLPHDKPHGPFAVTKNTHEFRPSPDF